MQQSPSGGHLNRPAGQEVSWLLWKPNVHYLVHKVPPVESVVKQVNPVRVPISYNFTLHFIIRFLYKLWFHK
jgi:hypothetical protein